MFAFFDLKAVNPDRNIDRYYFIYVDKTLFKEHSLIVNHGRNRFKGRTRTYYYSDIDSLSEKLVHILKRRFSAKKRLGTNYELIDSQWDSAFIHEILPLLINKGLHPLQDQV